MSALLVALAAMGILMSVALPVWSQAAKREREAELVFRGEQYARAVELYQRTYAATYPPDIEALIDERFLRQRYRDPMTADGEFRVVYQAEVADLLGQTPMAPLPGQGAGRPEAESDADGETVTGGLQLGDEPPAAGARGGVVGVISRSDEESLMIYNGGTKYSEWAFVYPSSTAKPGAGQMNLTPTPGQVAGPRPSPVGGR